MRERLQHPLQGRQRDICLAVRRGIGYPFDSHDIQYGYQESVPCLSGHGVVDDLRHQLCTPRRDRCAHLFRGTTFIKQLEHGFSILGHLYAVSCRVMGTLQSLTILQTWTRLPILFDATVTVGMTD